MKSRIIMMVLFWALVIMGCASTEDRARKTESHHPRSDGTSITDITRMWRIKRIKSQYPQWDEATVQKLAAKQVEIGMIPEMVTAALGKPDAISRQGDEDKWGYALIFASFDGPARLQFVYFVYFKNGRVTRTEGDRGSLL